MSSSHSAGQPAGSQSFGNQSKNQTGKNQDGSSRNPWQTAGLGQSGARDTNSPIHNWRSSRDAGRSQREARSTANGGSNCSIHGCENVGHTERIVSAGLGGLLVASGIVRGRLPGLLLTAVGASLLYRGLSGYCALYQQLGIDTNEQDESSGSTSRSMLAPDHHAIKGVKIEEEFVIDRSAHELYDVWTRWEQLPDLLPHIKQIETLGNGRTRWTAYAPLGATLTWEAETIKQEADRMVSWKSVSGDVGTAGSVHFHSMGENRTRMQVNMQYEPPGGKVAAQIAEFFGVGLDRRVLDDLQQFKHRLESKDRRHVDGAHAATS